MHQNVNKKDAALEAAYKIKRDKYNDGGK